MTCLRFLPLLLLAFVPVAYGDEASRVAKTEEYIRLAKLDETFTRSMAMVRQQMKSADFRKMLGVGTLSPEGEALLTRLQGSVEAVVDKTLGWNVMKGEYVRIFSEAYTEKELDDLIAFYRSPTGQATVAKTPAVMTKTNEAVQQRMAGMQAEMGALMKKFMEEAAALPKK